MNMFRTGILIAGMTSVFLFCGFLLGGEGGMIIALLIAIAMNGFAYWNADKVVLRIYGAKEVNRVSAPAYYGIVEQLPINPELPMPQVYMTRMTNPMPLPPAVILKTRPLPPRQAFSRTLARRKWLV